MRRGTRRLLTLDVPSPAPDVLEGLSNADKLSLGLVPNSTVSALLQDCFEAVVDAIVEAAGGPAWDRASYDVLRSRVAAQATELMHRVVRLAIDALVAAQEVDRRLSGRAELAMLPALTDMKDQWGRLMQPGFVAHAGLEHLRHYPRYFAAMGLRLDALTVDPRRDSVLMGTIVVPLRRYLDQLSGRDDGLIPDDLAEVGWMLEELRVSLWAQQLKTPRPVSPQRVEKALNDL